MSKADDLFISMCSDIIEHGTTTEGQRVRPHWEDGHARLHDQALWRVQPLRPCARSFRR